MKKVLLGVAGVIGLVVVGVLGMATMEPDTSHIERSATFAAAPADVFPYLQDFDRWIKWNPWFELDPAEKLTFSENHAGEGAWYEWAGNSQVGSGKMTITKVVDGAEVDEDLEFREPFQAKAKVKFLVAAEGENTKVTWTYDGDNDLMGKVMGVFMDMDAMLGKDFLHGLDKLKPLVEADAKARKEAETAAAAAAAAAAALPVDPNAPAAAPATP